MSSVNKVNLLGRLGRDPEVRYTQDGKPIATVSLATSETWKDKSGQKQEKTEWHRVVVFGGKAEVVEKYLKKGDLAYFEGKLVTRKWTNKDGQDQYTTEVSVDMFGQLVLIGGGGNQGNKGNQPSQSQASSQQASQADDDPFDDDIPF